MALNREQKRLMKKQGDVGDGGGSSGGDADGEDGATGTSPSTSSRSSRPVDRKAGSKATATKDKEQRTTARVFVKEVRGELRKVAWPTRKETFQYSGVVAFTLVIMTTLIFLLDYVFQEFVLRLFNVK